MDIEQDDCPLRFPADSFGSNGFSASSKTAAEQQAAAKLPAPRAQRSAVRPAAKPAAKSSAKPAAKSSAKPLGKAAARASKPSLARSTAKLPAAARASQPQHVTTVSDDDEDDDDEEMPDLVSSDDSGEDDDNDSNATDAPPGLLTSDEEDDFGDGDTKQHEKASPAFFDHVATELDSSKDSTAPQSSGHRLPAKGIQQAGSTKGKAALSVEPAEPMFRPVSRGFLAQQTSSQVAKFAQAGSASHAAEDTNINGLKEASSGTPFLFGRAVAGGSKEPAAAPSGKAGTGSKADRSVPISEQPTYPFPQASLIVMPVSAMCHTIPFMSCIIGKYPCSCRCRTNRRDLQAGLPACTWLGLCAQHRQHLQCSLSVLSACCICCITMHLLLATI